MQVSYGFCKDFISTMMCGAIKDFGCTASLVQCLDKMTVNSRDGDVYHSYVLNYKTSLLYLNSLRNELEEMSAFEKVSAYLINVQV